MALAPAAPPPDPQAVANWVAALAAAQQQGVIAAPAQQANRRVNFVKEPEEFNGDPRKYVEWKRTLLAYVENHVGIPTNEPDRSRDRIVCAKSYMKGDRAGVWAQNHTATEIARLTAPVAAGTPPPAPETWNEFLVKLDTQYMPKTLLKDARERLRLMTQKANESAADFFSRYDQARIESQMTDARFDPILLLDLKHQVQPMLHLLVSLNPTFDNFTYDQYKAEAIRLNDSVGSLYTGLRQSTPATAPKNTNTEVLRASAVTERPREQGSRTIGPCYDCGEMGHLARNCPRPKKGRFSRGPPRRLNVRQLLTEGGLTLDEIHQGINEFVADNKKDFPKPL